MNLLLSYQGHIILKSFTYQNGISLINSLEPNYKKGYFNSEGIAY